MIEKAVKSCKQFCICIEIEEDFPILEKSYAEIANILIRNKMKFLKEEKENDKNIKLFAIDKKTDFPLSLGGILILNKNNLTFTFRLYEQAEKFIDDKIIKELPFRDELINYLEKKKLKSRGYICGDFNLDISKFRFLLMKEELPYKYFVDEKFRKMVGKPFLSGMTFELQDSPLGLDELSISKEDKVYLIEIRMIFETKKYKELFINSYKQVAKICDIFMEEV